MNHVNLNEPCLAQVGRRENQNGIGALVAVCAGKCTLHAETNLYAYREVIYFARFYIFILHKVQREKKKRRKEGVTLMHLLFCPYMHRALSFIGDCHA